jgi:hypothetical protein
VSREDLKGLADFINNYLEKNNDWRKNWRY